jgi:ubiquinone/menaquinone biosynthesis C-methylase UbiE
MSQKKKIINEYRKSEVADVFDNERKKYLFQKYKHKIEFNFLKKTIMLFDKNKKIKILDVACGTGRMLPEITRIRKNLEYHGLDSSEEMTFHLKRKAKKMNFPVNIKIGDATKLPYGNDTFDLAYTYHLTWHLPVELQIKTISEMLRVVKDNGYVLFDTLNSQFLWEKIKFMLGVKKTDGIHKLSVKDVKKFLKDYNYNIEKLSDFPVKNSFLYSILNIINKAREILPTNMFHMIFFRVKKKSFNK